MTTATMERPETLEMEFANRIDRFVDECNGIHSMLFCPAIDELQRQLDEFRQEEEDEQCQG